MERRSGELQLAWPRINLDLLDLKILWLAIDGSEEENIRERKFDAEKCVNNS